MILLIIFAFLAGVVTVLSPCILPLLPLILSSVDGSGKQRPLGVIVGFVASFTFFTLFLSSIVRLSGIPANSLRVLSIIILAGFGITLLIPQIQAKLELLFSRFASLAPVGKTKAGFWGGLLVGLSLGLLWTPCVGPILAAVISLAITGTVTAQAFIITLAYALGTAIPMFIIMMAGSTALQKIPWLVRNTGKIQKVFGVLMILTAVGIYLNVDRSFQSYILKKFPGYGTGLTKFEDIDLIQQQLNNFGGRDVDQSMLGKPMSEINMDEKGVVAPELVQGGEWFNSEPLQLSQLQGKVVLIDFWTYSCINCQRTFPYLRNWWTEYEDDGLVIIGVHSPEFEFEKSEQNLAKAIEDFDLRYPIMQDNNFATWRAYNNRYWPAKYLIDKEGNIRYTHFGEGDYDETEETIRQLLEEGGGAVLSGPVDNEDYQIYSRTPELYLGSARIEHLVSPEKLVADEVINYSIPGQIPANSFAYQGDWLVTPEYAAPSAGSSLLLNFEAREVFLVARPQADSSGFTVTLDGQAQYLGEDAPDGLVTVDSDSLYKLILLEEPGRHELRLDFLDGNVEIYAFTFG